MVIKVCVCGGAGYIGSHVVKELNKQKDKYEVVVFDNLSTGHRCAVPSDVPLEIGDLCDKDSIERVFKKYNFDAAMHFAGLIIVSESVKKPIEYFQNNIAGTLNLLQIMNKYNCKKFIFSSTAAVFGEPENIPIQVKDRTLPVNPYGDSKLMVEHILRWCDEAYDFKSVCLRYFNACGADEDSNIGEDHEVETHLIPLILKVPLGQRENILIFGDDYDTRDGTCVRDYIHVTDLADAHIKALDYLAKGNNSIKFNLGNGKGYTVKEIIEAARKVTGHPIPAKMAPRRDGDPATLIASSEEAENVLGWNRRYTNIEKIVETAWKFHQKFPNGFPKN